MEGFYRQKEEGLRKKQITSSSSGVCVTDYLIGADQKIPDWPVKTAYLGEVKRH